MFIELLCAMHCMQVVACSSYSGYMYVDSCVCICTCEHLYLSSGMQCDSSAVKCRPGSECSGK